MLILTRKSGEAIYIGDEIFVQIVEIKGKQVRLGIHAPKDIHIDRQEVYERKQAERNGNGHT